TTKSAVAPPRPARTAAAASSTAASSCAAVDAAELHRMPSSLAQTRGSRAAAWFPRRGPPSSIAAMEEGRSDSLAAWAGTAERVGATPRRLEKGSILARYLAALDAPSVVVAARFFGGTVFARHDARTTRVGPSLLTGALVAVSGADPATLGERYVAHGDAG